MENETKQRQTGIDFLRMILMFMVVILHVLGHGGVLYQTRWMSGQYLAAWLLEVIAFCAVNSFALISGYVGVKVKFRWGRLLNLWFQILFYSLSLTLLCAILMPGSVSAKDWVKSIIPVSSGFYWYITAYTGMFFLIPFLNLLIDKIESRAMLRLLVSIYIFLCFPSCIFSSSFYGFNSGYSTIWLCILYLAGGYISKYNVAQYVTRKKSMAVFTISSLLAFISKIVIECIINKLLGTSIPGEIFISYLSPMILVNAIAMLCFFANMEFRLERLNRLVTKLAPASLGVYLIHDHPIVAEMFLEDKVKFVILYSPLKLAVCVIGLALGIFMVGMLIDIIRLRIFRLLKIPALGQKVDVLLDRWDDSKI